MKVAELLCSMKTYNRLGEYRITEYENGLLQWEKLFNFGVQRSGKCFILGNILIIGHWGHEEAGYLQLEFSELLQKLPIQYIMDEHSFDEKPFGLNLNQYIEPSKRLLRLSFKWLETAWHRIRGGKRWLKYLIPLFVAGLMLGLVLLWYSVEKKSLFPHGGKQHHREHDD